MIFRNYKLNILYKTNVKKKKKNLLYLNIFRSSNVKLNTINAMFN